MCRPAMLEKVQKLQISAKKEGTVVGWGKTINDDRISNEVCKCHFSLVVVCVETVISILFVEKNDENTFQSKTKHFSGPEGLRFEDRA